MPMIPVEKIHDPTWNSRLHFIDDKQIEGLAESIKARGQLQPILVDPKTDGGFELIAGSRRLAAIKLLGHKEIDATVRNYKTDSDKIIDNIIENVQRNNLTTFETARSYAKLRESGLKLKEVQEHTGAAQGTISKYVTCYTTLPDEIKAEWNRGNPACSMDFLGYLTTLKDPDKQIATFKAQDKLQKEIIANEHGDGPQKRKTVKPERAKRVYSIKVSDYVALREACTKVRPDLVSRDLLVEVLDYAIGKLKSLPANLFKLEPTDSTKPATKKGKK